MSKDITIVGAGLVGSLCALYMIKGGIVLMYMKEGKICVLKLLVQANL